MKCKSKFGGHFRLNEKGKWVVVNTPIQEELDFGEMHPNKEADKAGVPKGFPKELVSRPETLFQKVEEEV